MEDNFAAIIHKDAAALKQQYTDDYFRISETGKVSGKTKTIASFTNPDFEVTKLEPNNVKIRVYGNVAVVTELVTSIAGPTGKAPVEHVSRQTVVWVKRNDIWQKHVLQMTSTTAIPESAYAQEWQWLWMSACLSLAKRELGTRQDNSENLAAC